MASAQHRTPEYRLARKRYAALVKAGHGECAQPVCVMDDRWIHPDDPWDVAHDDRGVTILGPAHARCNRVEAGKKRHRIARSRNSRRELAADRWIL